MLCKCGCGKEVLGQGKEYCRGHHWKDPTREKSTLAVLDQKYRAQGGEVKLCACGCGLAINPKKTYAKGHVYRGGTREAILGDRNPMKRPEVSERVKEKLRGRKRVTVDGHYRFIQPEESV